VTADQDQSHHPALNRRWPGDRGLRPRLPPHVQRTGV